jgi:hypothetical protein
VGDAGFYKHPIPPQGITDAFRDAELLADAIDAGFTDRQPMLQALAKYERVRNETVMPMFERTVQRASLNPPPPELLELFGALRHNQSERTGSSGPMPEWFRWRSSSLLYSADRRGRSVSGGRSALRSRNQENHGREQHRAQIVATFVTNPWHLQQSC